MLAQRMGGPYLREFSRIAVVQTAYLGDVALTLPLLEALRQIHPGAQRAVVVGRPTAAALAACVEAVDEVILYDKYGADAGWDGVRRCARHVRQWGAEVLLVPHRSMRAALLTLWSAPRYAVGSSRSALPWVYTVRIPYGWHLHEIERTLAFLSPFADVGEQWRTLAQVVVSLRPLPAAEQAVAQYLRTIGVGKRIPLIVLAPGSAWQTKRWSAHHYAALGHELRARGYAVVLVGSAAEQTLCEAIADAGGIPSLAGRLDVAQLLVLLRRAACVVCNDSAPIHLAELVGTPVVAIFGPTIPQFGFAPRLPSSVVVERSLPCRPCSVHGGHHCPVGTHACLREIVPATVLQQVLAVLGEK